MVATLFLPDPTVLHLEHRSVTEDELTRPVRPTPAAACCPSCTCPSTRVHSCYIRPRADLPCGVNSGVEMDLPLVG